MLHYYTYSTTRLHNKLTASYSVRVIDPVLSLLPQLTVTKKCTIGNTCCIAYLPQLSLRRKNGIYSTPHAKSSNRRPSLLLKCNKNTNTITFKCTYRRSVSHIVKILSQHFHHLLIYFYMTFDTHPSSIKIPAAPPPP